MDGRSTVPLNFGFLFLIYIRLKEEEVKPVSTELSPISVPNYSTTPYWVL